MKPRKPRVLTRVADAYAGSDERIIEFSFPDQPSAQGPGNKGGLICLRTIERDGVSLPLVEVYRTDGEVQVRVPEKMPLPTEEQVELARLRAVAQAAADILIGLPLAADGEALIGSIAEGYIVPTTKLNALAKALQGSG